MYLHREFTVVGHVRRSRTRRARQYPAWEDYDVLEYRTKGCRDEQLDNANGHCPATVILPPSMLKLVSTSSGVFWSIATVGAASAIGTIGAGEDIAALRRKDYGRWAVTIGVI